MNVLRQWPGRGFAPAPFWRSRLRDNSGIFGRQVLRTAIGPEENRCRCPRFDARNALPCWACSKTETPRNTSRHACACLAVTKIVVGLDDNFPPMGFRDEKNELVGFDIDMARGSGQAPGP